jgi:hypothetical protein
MVTLKLNIVPNDKPLKVTVELPAAVHRDLVAYAELLEKQSDQRIPDPSKLIAPMVQRFMATDRGFARAKRTLLVSTA